MNFVRTKISKPATFRGFTLIELLVVVASIAVLAAILFPALAASGPGSRQMLCMNNIKQLTLAEIMYCSENTHSIPDRAPDGDPGMWVIYLDGYFNGATNLLICPTANQPQVSQNNEAGNAVTPWCKTDYDIPGNPAYFGGYAINGWLYSSQDGDYSLGSTLPGGGSGLTGYYVTGSEIEYPSRTPVFSDGIWVDGWPAETDKAYHNTFTGAEAGIGEEMSRYCIARHACDPFAQNTWTSSLQSPVGMVNVGLFDGHAELSTLPNLWGYYWHNNWAPSKVSIGTPF